MRAIVGRKRKAKKTFFVLFPENIKARKKAKREAVKAKSWNFKRRAVIKLPRKREVKFFSFKPLETRRVERVKAGRPTIIGRFCKK